MSKKEELRAIAQKAMAEMREIESAEKRQKTQALVGKCFAYRNCYSCPEGPEDYWTLWQKVIGVGENGDPLVFSFQIDKHGSITINTPVRESMGYLGAPTSPGAFADAWAELRERTFQLGAENVGPSLGEAASTKGDAP